MGSLDDHLNLVISGMNEVSGGFHGTNHRLDQSYDCTMALRTLRGGGIRLVL